MIDTPYYVYYTSTEWTVLVWNTEVQHNRVTEYIAKYRM